MLNLDPATLISRLIVLFTALTVHEFAHAWTANYFGDDTPRLNGRLTLNPLAHLDPIGSLMLIIAGFGWAKPVPVNAYALRRKSDSALMWVSLAGPLSNFLLALLAAIPFRTGLVSLLGAYNNTPHLFPSLPEFLLTFIYVNLALMLFNLIPLAPLDGEKVAEYFLPAEWQDTFDRIRPYGPMILLAFMALGVFSWIISPPLNFLVNLLLG
ncbi:MAG: hypothetical protein MAG431_00400 [Chloroflexi bacterium]|nr:hypothetical protein [Chloroflexota bacterium]